MADVLKLDTHPFPHHDENIFQSSEKRTVYSPRDKFEFLLQRANLRFRCTLNDNQTRPNFYPQASEILPGLYISDIYTATSPQIMDDLGITHVLSIHPEPPNFGKHFKSFWIRTREDDDQDSLLRILPHTTSFLFRAQDQRETQSQVLVCCFFGVNESPAVVIGYLIAQHWTYDAALEHVKSCRPVVNIDPNTKRQLLEWQRRRQRMLEKALESRLE